MKIIKKIIKPFYSSKTFKRKKQAEEDLKEKFHLDELFVKNFKEKGGKFLYCTCVDEIVESLRLILKESSSRRLLCYDHDLVNLTNKYKIRNRTIFSDELPFFTTCEHLIGNQGDIMFTENQLGNNKLTDFNEQFIVYATTSQIVKNTSEGMSGINVNFKGNIPSNICNVSYYNLKEQKESFMNYGNSNSKKTYLLLFEDL